MVYHPHARCPLEDHFSSMPIQITLAPGQPVPIGPNADKRRPKAVGSVALDCQIQLSRRVDDALQYERSAGMSGTQNMAV